MRSCFCIACVVALAMVLFGASGSVAQMLPLDENHYKVYTCTDTFAVHFPGGPLLLTDQFGTYQVDSTAFFKFANPVDKNGEGVVDPLAHQTWWYLALPQQPSRTVIVTDQFGSSFWTLEQPKYLVLPALKNPTDPEADPPARNHYLCYEALGFQPMVSVTLMDQFGTINTVVEEARYFCNPVKKTLPDGNAYPIVDDCAHLACYYIVDPTNYDREVTSKDQFGYRLHTIERAELLCVPAHKNDATTIQQSTWGKIKALYH